MTENNTIYLSSFFSEADVVIEKTVPSQYNLVQKLVRTILSHHLPGVEEEPVVNAVLRRERSAPTVVGDGVALPHARIEGLSQPYMAVGIFPAGIPNPEGKPVKLVFLLLVPESQPARYLQILRALANLLRVPGTVERFAAMTTGEEVMHFLRRSELKLPDYICAGDLMRPATEALSANAPLSAAIELLLEREVVEFPIVDEEKRLVGAVDTHALLGCFIPKGIRKIFAKPGTNDQTMEDLANRLHEANRTRIIDVMNTDLCTCAVDTPARALAADLAERNAVKCYVVDKDRHLIGVIPLSLFFRRILKD